MKRGALFGCPDNLFRRGMEQAGYEICVDDAPRGDPPISIYWWPMQVPPVADGRLCVIAFPDGRPENLPPADLYLVWDLEGYHALRVYPMIEPERFQTAFHEERHLRCLALGVGWHRRFGEGSRVDVLSWPTDYLSLLPLYRVVACFTDQHIVEATAAGCMVVTPRPAGKLPDIGWSITSVVEDMPTERIQEIIDWAWGKWDLYSAAHDAAAARYRFDYRFETQRVADAIDAKKNLA